MKQLFFLFTICIFTTTSYAQLTKGNWLVGGSGNFSSTKNTYSNIGYYQTSDVIDIKISPIVGYFLIDKFAIGLIPSFSKNKAQVTTPGGGFTNVNRFEIGPFIRYYLLNSKNQYNILTNISYQFGNYKFRTDKGNNNTFSAGVGPVIYFNSSVGLEFLLGYYRRKEVVKSSFETEQKGFQMSVGFQIHLEK